MTTVTAVIARLLRVPGSAGRVGRDLLLRGSQRVDSGSYQLDYGDDEHVFLLTVQQVPRRTLRPPQPVRVGQIEGLVVNLTGVVIDNLVHVHLDVPSSPRSTRLVRDHDADFEKWVADLPRRPGVHPPHQPAAQVLLPVAISLRDDVATTYTRAAKTAGGTGTEWHAEHMFLPAPPATARRLSIRLQVPDHDAVSADFTL